MPDHGSYGQFCPVAMASEIVCTRWTPLLLRELLCGSRRFNDLRRGVPRMSPTLLSRRLDELCKAGVVARVTGAKSASPEYHLTEAGEALRPIVMALGNWGQSWVDSKLSLKKLDPSLLMWDMRRNFFPKPLPKHRCTLEFHYPDADATRQHYWLVVETDGTIDLCHFDPGFEVNLILKGSLRAMTSVWMGASTLKQEVARGSIEIIGDRVAAAAFPKWLGLSPFARDKVQAAA
jgi:DNA-binding HxlR family transcriptional regulator